MNRSFKFFIFWLFLALGVTTILFNSCGKDDDNPSGSLTTDAGIMINGVKWATRNVDKPGTFTAKPEDPGMFYQWNSKIGWRYNEPLTPFDETSTWNDNWDGNGIVTWERANDPCPAGWRMPTQGELNGLISSGSVWTTVNGVNGRKFGSGSNILFLPAVGSRSSSDGMLDNVGLYGVYWSSTQDGDYSAYSLGFLSGNTGLDINYKANGFSCRCVAE